jgi:hypothetical protein
MKVLVLLAGVLLVVYGVASLAGGRAATYSCTPKPSRSTGAAVAAVGAVCVLAGLVWLVV